VNCSERLNIEKFIDHTLLRPDATMGDIARLCSEAEKYKFFAVCVHPYYVRFVSEMIRKKGIRVCSVAGFPFGADVSEVKLMQARRAIEDGADEIDMVINIGALKDRENERVYEDIKAVADECHDRGCIVKVIIEASLLTNTEKIRACSIVADAGADFVKTSTGFGGGATLDDVKLIKRVLTGSGVAIKASGGIRTLNDVMKFLSAGATRIGTSSGVKIMEEHLKRLKSDE